MVVKKENKQGKNKIYYKFIMGYHKPSRKTRKRRGSGRKKIAMTRARKQLLKKRAKTYRKRVKANASGCRKKRLAACKNKPGCKVARGKKRSFCRRSGKNRKL